MSDAAANGGAEPGLSASDTVSIGAKLATARRALDLSVADVARQIKLSVPQVEALEADDLSRLPKSPMIVKGFVRNYAKLVQLDADALLGTVQPGLRASNRSADRGKTYEAPLEGGHSRSWGKPFAAVFLALIAVALGYASYTNQDLLSLIGLGGEEERAPAAAPVAPKRSGPAAPVDTSKATAPVVEEAPPPAPLAPAAQPLPVPVIGTPLRAGGAEAPTAAAASGQGIVRLTFTRESWVEIRDRDGNRIFQRTNQPGTEQSVQGIPPLQLVVGNASGVKVTWNDQPVDLAPYIAKADIARFKLE